MAPKIRSIVLISIALLAADFAVAAQTTVPAPQDQAEYVRPDVKTRRQRYLKNMFGPEALVKSVAMAGFSTAENSPDEWGPHWNGFGKRVASTFGQEIISNTVRFGLEEAFALDSHYYRSRQHAVGSRIKNALISSVTARNAEGRRVFGFPRIVGTYSSHIIASEAWYPKRYNYKDGLKGGTISLGMTAAFNLLREFIHKK
ncbi:MAG TPA: hypothetical protein VHQ01_07790 [Pyrinomonadaceae bacterium]|nr:hypothetical protein [Pyrinomonadaceae bacterium]